MKNKSKKSMIVPVLIAAVLAFCGCTGCGRVETDAVGGADGPTAIFLAGGGQEQDGSADAGQTGGEDGGLPEAPAEAAVYAYSSGTVLDTVTGDIIFRVSDPRSIDGKDDNVRVAGSAETLFVLTSGEDAYTISAADRDGSFPDGADQDVLASVMRDIDTFSVDEETGIGRSALGYYQGKLYFLYETYDREQDKWVAHAYSYERQPDGSFAKEQDTLCGTLMELDDQEYGFCCNWQDIFTCLNEWDYLLMWKEEEGRVFAFGTDGALLWERRINPKITALGRSDGRFLIGIYYEDNELHYEIYDCAGTNGDGDALLQGTGEQGDEYMGIRDGYVYYQRKEAWAYGQYTRSFFRCALDPVGEEELLYETTDVPGLSSYVSNGKDGFTLWEDCCYFVDFDDGSRWWYSCDLADDAHPVTRLGLVKEYPGLFAVGEISYESGGYTCPDCQETIYSYYVERLELSENTVPHAEAINPFLLKVTEDIMEQVLAQKENLANNGCEDYNWTNTDTWYVDGTTQYSFRQTGREEELICLEVDYSGYAYWGGVHGMPLRDHYFFDLADGSEAAIGDIVGVSEEEFRVLAAEYTVKDYQERGWMYFYSDEGENGVYDAVYEYVDFDCLMRLSREGVVVEYSPYHLGPYASGYIEVTVPYEELGLELVDIYGVGMNG